MALTKMLLRAFELVQTLPAAAWPVIGKRSAWLLLLVLLAFVASVVLYFGPNNDQNVDATWSPLCASSDRAERWLPQLTTMKADDLVIGIITSDATVERVFPLENTWKGRSPAPVVIYGAGVGTIAPGDVDYLAWPVVNLHLPLRKPNVIPLPLPAGHTHTIVNETMALFRNMLVSFPDKKWYMKADDDTYINVPNLLVSLDHFNASADLYLGRPLFKNMLNSGGAGYVLSRSAMVKLLSKVDECIQKLSSDVGEDSLVGWCLKTYFNIEPTREAGHYISQVQHAMTLYRSEHPDGLVDYAISFHWVKPKTMYAYDYLSYYARVMPT